MSSILESVNKRTQLVGQNRLELLLFKLNGRQRFGINVFKVKEVLQCPPLTRLPKLNPYVKGVAHIRGETISIIDLSAATGGRPLTSTENCFVIISEYNRSVQGFLVSSVERIINMNWESILPPPQGSGRSSYLTAVTEIEGELVEILDVEKILDEISPVKTSISKEVSETLTIDKEQHYHIMVIDDSTVARKQIIRSLESLNLQIDTAKDGKEALIMLKNIAAEMDDVSVEIPLIISDIEMPEMDGYTLTAEIRDDPKLKNIKVVLHTSLSGVFNQAMVEKVGANDFIAKFNPDELASAVNKHLSL
ncbi:MULTISPECIES: chemotaxis protein CheV [Shewanella]|jgi:two-component system chemotaxis response regulator CheV|uniref:Chemotaxis protein CheV n=1 Tax=Shewanella psychromarinicola TaxID=2487742 RepID=A0A3N4ECT5_9GAMM|nr:MULTISPECIES: chemotaxis protein CheV [Shewanella]AZG37004.1 chemotaxis protein CheV [Shewanella psychromarinicola]MCL1081157.1 chemotaxis protein CheV [Shewanella psychromarinicola]PKG78240.1 chemotaxis protein CheW [Shewanella sp. Actino-trap-3]RPA34858.1 chemotaxis protein CheV [Shewanella psychromarinicola]|tara:strand:+ start:83819 stop:84739 length:921 start_codon:yes stop_codon:yes gene_type:complete